MYFVYILKCKDDSLYTGITTDLARRLEEHIAGRGAKYTRGKKAAVIVYSERKRNRSSASKREAEIKSWTRAQKIAFISQRVAERV